MTKYDHQWYGVIYRANCGLDRAVKEKDWPAMYGYLGVLDLTSPGQAAYARRYSHPLGRLL